PSTSCSTSTHARSASSRTATRRPASARPNTPVSRSARARPKTRTTTPSTSRPTASARPTVEEPSAMTLDTLEPDHAELVGLLQPFVDGELCDDERELVAKQIAQNPEYDAMVREQQRVQAALRSLPRELAPTGLRERVLADLDAVD